MSAIEDKKIVFYSKVINGRIRKLADSEINDPDIAHVIRFSEVESLNVFISNIDLAINGDYAQIDDNGFTTDDQIAFIEETAIEFYDQDGENIIGYGSLQDFKELLIAWRDFLLEPPLNGTEVSGQVSYV